MRRLRSLAFVLAVAISGISSAQDLRITLPKRSKPTPVQQLNLDGVKAVQLHGRETPEQTAEVARSIRWVIKAFPATSPNLPNADRYGTDLVLIDAPNPGSGKVFDWGLASEVPDGVRRLQVQEILYQPESAGDYHL